MTSSVTVDERAITSSQASHLRISSPHERPVSQETWGDEILKCEAWG